MPNNKIFVKVTQTLSQLGGRNVVTSGNVQLVARGPGTSVITTSDQSAVIEFFDESDKTNAIMTITGTVKLDGGGPKFNLNSATRNSTVGRTDFSLPFTFDQNTFDGSQFASSFTLILPWRIIKHGNVEGFRIGAQMKIAGTLEGPAFGDVLDLPLKHDQVDDDVEQVKDTCREQRQGGVDVRSAVVEGPHVTGSSWRSASTISFPSRGCAHEAERQ